MILQRLKPIICFLMVVILLPVSLTNFGLDSDSVIDIAPDDASEQQTLSYESTAIIESESQIQTEPSSRSSRQLRVNHIYTGSNNPNDGATPFSANDSILVGNIGDDEWHWFFTSSLKSPPSGKIYNFTITPTKIDSLGNDDWLLVRIYVFWDFNDNLDIDDKEMILLHQESYGQSSATLTDCWANACHSTDYYVCIEGNPKNPSKKIDYELTAQWFEFSPSSNNKILGSEMNYDHKKAYHITPYTPVKNKWIDMDYQGFDWYSISAPSAPPNSELLGINVTVWVDIESSSLTGVYSDGIALFVMEIQAVVLHETVNGNLIFGGVANASKQAKTINKHSTVPIDKDIRYYTTHFYQGGGSGDIIKKSYIGIFAVTYGINLETNKHTYYDGTLDTDDEDAALNGWLEYSFNKTNSEPIVRPTITTKIYSARTLIPYGKTYDRYIYHVFYTNPANYGPMINNGIQPLTSKEMHVYIITQDLTTFRVPLIPVDEENTKFIRPPAEYYCIVDGNDLKEGDHRFQIICNDRHTYAEGSKATKTFYDGPFISNNIPPLTRKTAITNIIMKEDDEPMIINLDDIFEDVNYDPITTFIIDDEGNKTLNYVTPSLVARIIDDNSKLKLDPKTNQFGNNIIQLECSDKKWPMINATHRLEVTIEPVNDPPIIKTPFDRLFFFGEIRFDEDTTFSNLNLNDVFWDPVENDPIVFFATGFENVRADLNETGGITFWAKENWSGTEEITFYAIDIPPSNLPSGIVSDVLRVVVEPVNDKPIFNETFKVICYEETWTNMTFDAWDPADNDPLIFDTDIQLAIGLSSDDFIFNEKTGELNLYPPNRVATGGEYTVTVTVEDIPDATAGDPLSASQEIIFIVRNTWDRPTCEIVEPKNGDRFLHFEPITFRGICLDDDMKVRELDETIEYEWHSNIDGKIGNKDIVRKMTLSAGEDGQEHVITLKVSDGKYNAYSSIKIWLLKENQKRDTDEDGMPDYWEDRNNLDKINPEDAGDDPDQDRFSNLEEFKFGEDGIEGTNDPTDPWDPESHPPEELQAIEKKEEKEDFLVPILVLVIIIILVLVLIATTYMFVVRKVSLAKTYAHRRYELEKLRHKRELDKQEADMKYGLYSAKKHHVLCHKCGHRNKVKSMKRPLAVRCEQCNTRGVIY